MEGHDMEIKSTYFLDQIYLKYVEGQYLHT